MQLIIWRVRKQGYHFTLLGALLTAFLAHIGCIGTLILVPLGFGGFSVLLEKTVSSLSPWILLVPIILLSYTGWKVYANPRTQLIEKVIFWTSVGIVILMIALT